MGERSERALLEQAVQRLRESRAQLDAAQASRHEPVAVLGVGIRSPGGAQDPGSFWQLLRDGVDAVGPLLDSTDGRREGTQAPAGQRAGLLSEVDGFDAAFFGLSDAEADRLDPQQRLVLEVGWEALEDAGVPLERLQSTTTGVFLGLYGTDYMTMQLTDPQLITAYTAPGAAHSAAANRLSYLLDLRGPSLAVDTACSSSLVAVHLAVQALRAGECDLALVGGVNVVLSPTSSRLTETVLPLAPGGACRAFDAAADGIVRAEGCGMLLLQRAGDARAAGHRVAGLIRGSAVNHNGRTNGLTAPSPRAQVDVLRRALANAAADPQDVVYVEAHGTGTALGDPIEMDALRTVYGTGERRCLVGSVKTNLGHQEAAAGIVGLIKTLQVLGHGEAPAHLHLRRLNPEIQLAGTRLAIPTALSALPAHGPRLGAVSSFGFSGANCHVLLEAVEPLLEQPDDTGTPIPGCLILPLSARTPQALAVLSRTYADLLEADHQRAGDLCAASALGRTAHPVRRAIAADSPADLIRQLRTGHTPAPTPGGSPRIGFLFSGQGSQWSGMGRDVLAAQPVLRAEVERCDEIVRELAGWSVLEELTTPPERSRVHETEIAQLTVGALQIGLVALWRFWGVEPEALAGHSMGEVIAAHVAGALDLGTTLQLLLQRARHTEKGARGGAMASIGWPVERVRLLLASMDQTGRVGARVDIAAVNSPTATVISGNPDAVAAVTAAAAATGAWTRRLRVEYAFHSALLSDSADELATSVDHLQPGRSSIPLYSTVTGQLIDSRRLDGKHWARNVRDTVLFDQAVRAMADDGVRTFVEIGPHPVLLQNIQQILAPAPTPSSPAQPGARGGTVVGSLRRHQRADSALYRSLAALWSAGVAVTWEPVTGPIRSPVRLPSYPWQRRRHWLPAKASDTSAANTASGPPASSHPPRLLDPGYVRAHLAHALGVRTEDFSADVPLATLALDSLMVVELKNRVESEFGVSVPLLALLESTTQDELTRVLEQALIESAQAGQS